MRSLSNRDLSKFRKPHLTRRSTNANIKTSNPHGRYTRTVLLSRRGIDHTLDVVRCKSAAEFFDGMNPILHSERLSNLINIAERAYTRVTIMVENDHSGNELSVTCARVAGNFWEIKNTWGEDIFQFKRCKGQTIDATRFVAMEGKLRTYRFSKGDTMSQYANELCLGPCAVHDVCYYYTGKLDVISPEPTMFSWFSIQKLPSLFKAAVYTPDLHNVWQGSDDAAFIKRNDIREDDEDTYEHHKRNK